MAIKKQIALDFIARAIKAKALYVGTQAYINGKYASNSDLTTLYERINDGRDCLVGARTNSRGHWHFATV